MRSLLALVVVALVAGCTADAPAEGATDEPRVATRIVLIEDVLFSPSATSATFPYELFQEAASGTVQIELSGAFQGLAFEGPASCEDVDPPQGGSVGMTLDCREIPAGEGELVLRIASGTAQGRISFAVSHLVR